MTYNTLQTFVPGGQQATDTILVPGKLLGVAFTCAVLSFPRLQLSVPGNLSTALGPQLELSTDPGTHFIPFNTRLPSPGMRYRFNLNATQPVFQTVLFLYTTDCHV